MPEAEHNAEARLRAAMEAYANAAKQPAATAGNFDFDKLCAAHPKLVTELQQLRARLTAGKR